MPVLFFTFYHFAFNWTLLFNQMLGIKLGTWKDPDNNRKMDTRMLMKWSVEYNFNISEVEQIFDNKWVEWSKVSVCLTLSSLNNITLQFK